MKNTSKLTPITRESTCSNAVNQIKAFIKSQGLRHGDKLLSERVLGEQLQISRSSVRESIRALEAEKIVEVRHGAGTYIRQDATGAFLHDEAEGLAATEGGPLAIMQARLAVEPAIASLAAKNPSDTLIRSLKEATEAMRAQIGKAEPTREHDIAFHQSLAEFCGNPVMGEFGCRLCSLRRRLPWKAVMDSSLSAAKIQQDFAVNHDQIIDAIRNKDEKHAGEYMQKHLNLAQREVVRRMKNFG